MASFAIASRTLIRRVACSGIACMATMAFAGEPFPPSGLYRVDIVGTTGASAGGMRVESTTQTQGATGDTTVTQQATGQAPVPVGSYKGNAPVTACLKPTTDPAAAYAMQKAGGCKPDRPKTAGDTMTFDLQCPTLTQQIQSRRIDERTWELRTITRHHAMTLANAPAATVAAMGPVIAKMEERLRAGPPAAEAAAIRQQLDMLRGGAGAPSPGSPGSTIVQKYTKVADTCS
jgi:hypothetical protein